MVYVLLQMALAAVVFYSCFCRLLHTKADTKRSLRWTLTLEAGAALLVAGAPIMSVVAPVDFHWAPWDTPDWVWLTFLAASMLLHMATAPFWLDLRAMNLFKE